MAEEPTSQSNLAKFVQEMSEAAGRVEEYERDPEEAMTAAGLSEEEKEIVRRGDEQEILNAIGMESSRALRFIFRIRNMRFGV